MEAKPRGYPNHRNTSETQHSTTNHPPAITVFADPLDAEQSFSMLSAGQYIQETPTLLMVLLASHYTTAHPFQNNVQRMYKRIVHCSKDVQAKRYARFACIQTSSTHGLLPWIVSPPCSISPARTVSARSPHAEVHTLRGVRAHSRRENCCTTPTRKACSSQFLSVSTRKEVPRRTTHAHNIATPLDS